MQTIEWLFLESPAALAGVAFVTLFTLLVVWRRHNKPRPLQIALPVFVALFVLQALVTTPREAVLTILGGIEQDMLRARTSSLEAALADNFAAGGMDRTALVELVKVWQQRLTFHTVTRTASETHRRGERVEAVVAYLTHLRDKDFSGFHRSRWRVEFEFRDGRYQIVTVDPLAVDGAAPGWEGLRR